MSIPHTPAKVHTKIGVFSLTLAFVGAILYAVPTKGGVIMRIDRVKLISEMARQDIRAQELADKASLSRATIVALRCGKSCTENSVRRVAQALGVPIENLLS